MISEESDTTESQYNAVFQRAMWEVQSTARSLVRARQQHRRVTLPLWIRVRNPAIEYAAQLLNGTQRAATDNRTANELRWKNVSTEIATTWRNRNLSCTGIYQAWWKEPACCWLERHEVRF